MSLDRSRENHAHNPGKNVSNKTKGKTIHAATTVDFAIVYSFLDFDVLVQRGWGGAVNNRASSKWEDRQGHRKCEGPDLAWR